MLESLGYVGHDNNFSYILSWWKEISKRTNLTQKKERVSVSEMFYLFHMAEWSILSHEVAKIKIHKPFSISMSRLAS